RHRSPGNLVIERRERCSRVGAFKSARQGGFQSAPLVVSSARHTRPPGNSMFWRASMKLKTAWLCTVLACLLLAVGVNTQAPYKAKRINRAIELLEAGQPIYYTGSHSGTSGTVEQGKADAGTYADYISYDMEHAPFDVHGLSEYMKGLAAAGPTRSGHKTPAVIVNVPVNGIDAATIRANAWM